MVHHISHVFIAVGDNQARARLTNQVRVSGLELDTAIASTAIVSRSVSIAPGSLLCAGSVVSAAARIGVGVIVNTNASVDHDCVIGDFSHLAPAVALAGDVHVGTRTLVGIGARVLPGIHIGDDVIIGAGSVVTRDVPDGVTVVGAPARILQRSDR